MRDSPTLRQSYPVGELKNYTECPTEEVVAHLVKQKCFAGMLSEEFVSKLNGCVHEMINRLGEALTSVHAIGLIKEEPWSRVVDEPKMRLGFDLLFAVDDRKKPEDKTAQDRSNENMKRMMEAAYYSLYVIFLWRHSDGPERYGTHLMTLETFKSTYRENIAFMQNKEYAMNTLDEDDEEWNRLCSYRNVFVLASAVSPYPRQKGLFLKIAAILVEGRIHTTGGGQSFLTNRISFLYTMDGTKFNCMMSRRRNKGYVNSTPIPVAFSFPVNHSGYPPNSDIPVSEEPRRPDRNPEFAGGSIFHSDSTAWALESTSSRPTSAIVSDKKHSDTGNLPSVSAATATGAATFVNDNSNAYITTVSSGRAVHNNLVAGMHAPIATNPPRANHPVVRANPVVKTAMHPYDPNVALGGGGNRSLPESRDSMEALQAFIMKRQQKVNMRRHRNNLGNVTPAPQQPVAVKSEKAEKIKAEKAKGGRSPSDKEGSVCSAVKESVERSRSSSAPNPVLNDNAFNHKLSTHVSPLDARMVSSNSVTRTTSSGKSGKVLRMVSSGSSSDSDEKDAVAALADLHKLGSNDVDQDI